jgi:septum site-determining protein MinD
MSKVIVITSGKGGVGKTTTAINLGAAINHFGGDVLVVDGNLSTPNLGIHLGSPEVPINLNHVLTKKADVFEAVYEHDSGMKIMPSSLSIKEFEKIDPRKIKDSKKELEKVADYVIIDSAAGLGEEAKATINMADELIVVTNPEMPAITDALKTIKTAQLNKKNVIGVIVTRVKQNKIEMNSDTVKEMLEIPVLGMVPEDLCISEALSMKDSVIHTHPKSKPSRAYKEIAAKLIGTDYNSEQDRESIWTRIVKAFKK